MMKLFSILIAAFLFTLYGCANDQGLMREDERISNQHNPNTNITPQTGNDVNEQLGYVRYSKNEMDEELEANHSATIDRNTYADMITRIILRHDGFREVATLVTDREVLIAYEKDDGMERETAADIAKKTAESVMPGFFDIYVSDNKSLIGDIQSLHNSSTNREYDNLIEQLINKMKETPQER